MILSQHMILNMLGKMIDPKNGFVYSFLIVETIQNGAEISAGKLAPNELGVTAVDDYTLKVTLKEPKPYFTSLLAFPTFFPQNQKVVEQFGADYGTASDKVVYNGPFVVKDWQQTKMDWQLAKIIAIGITRTCAQTLSIIQLSKKHLPH